MIQLKIQKKLQSASGEMLLNLDFEIKENEFVTLYGASGSGPNHGRGAAGNGPRMAVSPDAGMT